MAETPSFSSKDAPSIPGEISGTHLQTTNPKNSNLLRNHGPGSDAAVYHESTAYPLGKVSPNQHPVTAPPGLLEPSNGSTGHDVSSLDHRDNSSVVNDQSGLCPNEAAQSNSSHKHLQDNTTFEQMPSPETGDYLRESQTTPIHSWLPGRLETGDDISSSELFLQHRSEGLDRLNLTNWATKNGIKLNGVEFVDLPNGMGKGIKATREFKADTYDRNFVEVPKSVILNIEFTWTMAEEDDSLRDVLIACEPFSTYDRGAIILFLLVQMTRADLRVTGEPDLGPDNSWVEYIGHFLQNNTALPSRWKEEDRRGLWATTLERLAERKVCILREEYESILDATQDIPWCRKYWLAGDRLTFDDYCFVDTIYRSRAMELSGLGNCLVPIMDMANHDDESNYIASYTFEEDTDYAELALEFGRYITVGPEGTEITINYGWEKTPADMLMAYGFFDHREYAAGLDLYVPPEHSIIDHLAVVKQMALGLPPVVHIRAKQNDNFEFKSALLQALVITPEDGLRIEKSDEKTMIYFHDEEMISATQFLGKLKTDSKSAEFYTRFYSVLKEFLEDIIRERRHYIYSPGSADKRIRPATISDANWRKCEELRRQELACLEAAVSYIDRKLRFNMPDFESIPIAEGYDTSDINSNSESSQVPPKSSRTSHSLQDVQSSGKSAEVQQIWQPYVPGINSGDISWESHVSSESQPGSNVTGHSITSLEVEDMVSGIKRMRFTDEDRRRARELVREEHFAGMAREQSS